MTKVNYLCISPNIDTLWALWYIQVGSKKFDLQLEVARQATASAPIISCEDLKSCFIGSKAATTQHLLTTWSFPLCFRDNKKYPSIFLQSFKRHLIYARGKNELLTENASQNILLPLQVFLFLSKMQGGDK